MADALPLALAFAERHTETAADVLDEVDPAAAAALAAKLPVRIAADLLAGMQPEHAAVCLGAAGATRATDWLRHMRPRDAAAILRVFDEKARQEAVERLPKTRQMQIGLILRQPRQTVGAWMDSRAIAARADTAIAALRRRLGREDNIGPEVFVVDDQQRLVGSVPLSAVMAADEKAALGSLMGPPPPHLRVNLGIESALEHEGWLSRDALPALDRDGVLVGIVRHAQLRRAMAESRAARGGEDRIGSVMDLANIWYLGMAEAMDASLARRSGGPGTQTEEKS